MAAEADGERLVVLLEARIRDFEKNMKRASGTADKSYARMRGGSRSATRMMEADMSRSTRRINQLLASTSTQIGVLGRSFAGAFAGGIFAGGIGGIVRGVRSITSELSELGKVADKVGLGTTALQQLRHVAGLAGVEANSLDTAMQRFSRRVAQAAAGGGELYEILKANNVQLRNADGSMRSQVDILKDYADLIRNAGSDQERLLLAFKAFDTEGAALVNLFKDGSAAIDTMAMKTEQAGGVIEDHLIRRAEELDDKWAILWRNFEINAKSAVFSVVSALDAIEGKLGDLGNSDFFKWLSEKMGTGDAIFIPGEGIYKPGTDELSPDAKVAQAFQLTAQSALENADQALIDALRKRYGEAADTARKTVIPDSGDGDSGSRDAAADAALREAEAVQALIDNLTHELSLIGLSDVEREKANALRQAGAAATEEQRAQISALIDKLHEESEAQQSTIEAQEMFNDVARQGFSELTGLIETGNEALDRMIERLAEAVLQAALLGSGPLGGLFGGGLFSGGFGPGFAQAPGPGMPINIIPTGPLSAGPMAMEVASASEVAPAVMTQHQNNQGLAGHAGKPDWKVEIHQHGDVQAEISERDDGSLVINVERMVDDAVAKSFQNRGSAGRAAESVFGLSRINSIRRVRNA